MNYYTVEGAKRKATQNKIIISSIFGLVSIFEILIVVWVVNGLKNDSFEDISGVLLYFVSLLWIILLVLFITYLTSNKVYTFTYKEHTISAYNGGHHHITFLDGKFVEDYGVIWWQHTAVVRIDEDMVCVKYGPIGVHEYVRPNFYSNKYPKH